MNYSKGLIAAMFSEIFKFVVGRVHRQLWEGKVGVIMILGSDGLLITTES